MDFLNRPKRSGRVVPLLLSSLLLSALLGQAPNVYAKGLGLSYVLSQVKQNDITLERFLIDAEAFEAEAESQSLWSDPVLFAGAQNFPTDTFNFGQEPMTQIRFGVRQKVPVGDTLEIKNDIGQLKSAKQLIGSDMRWLKLKKATEQAWLEGWYWQKTIEILDDDAVFLKQALDITQSLYSVGAREQSDVISAELELIQLDERRIDARQKFATYRNTLNTLANQNLKPWVLSSNLEKTKRDFLVRSDEAELISRIQTHPEVRDQDQAISIARQGIELAEQSYQPKWGFEVSYGLRNGTGANGSDRPDFLTAGISMQVPLFDSISQDKKVRAAQQRRASAENARLDRLTRMQYQYKNVLQQYETSLKQSELYETQILPKLSQQKQSKLNAYQSDRAQFNSVVMVYLKEQKSKLKYQRLLVNQEKMLSKLNYWIPLQTDKGAENMKNTHESKSL